MRLRFTAFTLFALALVVGLFIGGRAANALSGGVCATAAVRYFSVVCHNSNTAWSGMYAKWPSAALNISQAAATSGRFVAQAIWLNDQWASDANFSFLEIGDTAGGGAIPGHVNEWARMTYWVRGTASSQFQSFWAYSPTDGVVRSYGFQYNAVWSGWDLCQEGICPFGYGWKNPASFSDTRAEVGMEINNGSSGGIPFALSANMSTGLFTDTLIQVRYLNDAWTGFPSALKQVDAPCGTVPTCLQGWWQNATPPYDNFNNAKP